MFEDQYKELFAAVDEVAERSGALGEPAPGSFEAFSKLTKVSPPKDGIEGSAMVRACSRAMSCCPSRPRPPWRWARRRATISTVDLLTDRISYHDKTAWMLRSTAA